MGICCCVHLFANIQQRQQVQSTELYLSPISIYHQGTVGMILCHAPKDLTVAVPYVAQFIVMHVIKYANSTLSHTMYT